MCNDYMPLYGNDIVNVTRIDEISYRYAISEFIGDAKTEMQLLSVSKYGDLQFFMRSAGEEPDQFAALRKWDKRVTLFDPDS